MPEITKKIPVRRPSKALPKEARHSVTPSPATPASKTNVRPSFAPGSIVRHKENENLLFVVVQAQRAVEPTDFSEEDLVQCVQLNLNDIHQYQAHDLLDPKLDPNLQLEQAVLLQCHRNKAHGRKAPQGWETTESLAAKLNNHEIP